jgi:hypothetical protein
LHGAEDSYCDLWSQAVYQVGTNPDSLYPEDLGTMFLRNVDTHLPCFAMSSFKRSANDYTKLFSLHRVNLSFNVHVEIHIGLLTFAEKNEYFASGAVSTLHKCLSYKPIHRRTKYLSMCIQADNRVKNVKLFLGLIN